jgi:hypothetical protein
MSYRPNESFIPKQQRKKHISVVYFWQKKNLEHQINIKFCKTTGKSASEMLALLTLAYGEYSNKKLSILNGIGSSRKGVKM